jgi:hypothetical protein
MEDSIAISKVSPSRISHTMIISGSCLSAALNHDKNVNPISDLTCAWFNQSILFSTGSSNVVIFTSTLLTSERAEYSVVVFHDPVGHVFKIIPFGYHKFFSKIRPFDHSNQSADKGGISLDLSTIRITNFSHQTVGKVLARRSISLFVSVVADTLAS